MPKLHKTTRNGSDGGEGVQRLYFAPVGEQKFYLCDAPGVVQESAACLRDIIRRGRRSASGRRVLLEICVLPRGIGTTLEAYNRFLERLQK
jgi:hypothetical protein